jgi:hypothetical protein
VENKIEKNQEKTMSTVINRKKTEQDKNNEKIGEGGTHSLEGSKKSLTQKGE